MDIRKIQERLRLKGIRIKDDDSAFHLVALNELVLSGILNNYKNGRGSLRIASMNIDAMRALLLEKGIRVAHDDPIFACIAINEIILEDIAGKCQKQLSTKDKFFFTIKQPSLLSYAKVIVPLSLIFTAALFFDDTSLRQGLTLLLGGSVGAALSFFVMDYLERRGIDVSLNPKQIEGSPQPISAAWSQVEFDQAVMNSNSNGKRLSDRSIAACKAILVNGKTREQVILAEGVQERQIFHALSTLEKHRK